MPTISISKPIKATIKFDQTEPKIKFVNITGCLPVGKLIFEFKKFINHALCTQIETMLLNLDEIFDDFKEDENVDDFKKFKFMDSLIFLLEESGIYSYKNPYLKQNIIKKFWDLSVTIESKPETSFFAFKRYLSLCLDDKNEEWLKFEDETAGRAPLDREEEVYKIVFENYKKGIIRKELFCDKKHIQQEKIKSWFLANYDLYNLKRFEKGLKLHKKPCCAEKREKIEFQTFEYKDIIRNDNWFRPRNSLFFFLPLALLLVLFFQLPPLNYIKQHYSDAFRIFVGIAMCSSILYMYYHNKFDNYSSLLRLAGCILAGYFAINSDESWSGILLFENDWLEIIYRWAILGFFTFLYLKREISNKIKKNKLSEKLKTSVFRKTSVFFIRTAGYSLIIGIFFSDFFGKVLILRNDNELKQLLDIPSKIPAIESIAHFPFIAGNIYPEVILSQAPLAMFIGIFINLLWEDKALTEPL